jgi:hypothetical protein
VQVIQDMEFHGRLYTNKLGITALCKP